MMLCTRTGAFDQITCKYTLKSSIVVHIIVIMLIVITTIIAIRIIAVININNVIIVLPWKQVPRVRQVEWEETP